MLEHNHWPLFLSCVSTKGHGRREWRWWEGESDPGWTERAGGEGRSTWQTEDQEHLCHQVSNQQLSCNISVVVCLFRKQDTLYLPALGLPGLNVKACFNALRHFIHWLNERFPQRWLSWSLFGFKDEFISFMGKCQGHGDLMYLDSRQHNTSGTPGGNYITSGTNIHKPFKWSIR